jgi:hypothetical protein
MKYQATLPLALLSICSFMIETRCAEESLTGPHHSDGRDFACGYIDHQGRAVIGPGYDDALPFSEGLGVVEVQGRRVFVDQEGREVAQVAFAVAPVGFSEGLIPASDGSKYGYVDRSGKWVIAPRFDCAFGFVAGRATVVIHAEAKVGESRPNVARLQDIESWTKGRTTASSERREAKDSAHRAFIDRTGAIVFHGEYDSIGTLHCGRAVARQGTTYRYLDSEGRIAFGGAYSGGADFSEGVAAVSAGGKWGYVDPQGRIVIAAQFERANSFREGKASVKIDGRWGFINRVGKVVVAPQYDFAYDFSEGLAGVEIAGRYGFVDGVGRMVVSPVYDDVNQFSEGRAVVLKGERYGYIDSSGNAVTGLIFSHASDFSEGLAAVSCPLDVWPARKK